MKIITSGALLLISTSMAHAVGLDRSNQDITAIFEDGNYIELTYGNISPTVSGTDNPNPYNPGGQIYGDVANDFTLTGGSIKLDINENLSFALIGDVPFSADILYPGAANTWLGGTAANIDSFAFTALGRYRINDNFSVHAGLRTEQISAMINLGGAAYSNPANPADPTDGLNGYRVDLASNRANGYVAGVAYERPEIALRVALTYNSAMTHEFETTESIDGAVLSSGTITSVDTPEAWNLDFQSGVAENTLVFGQIRYAYYSQLIVSPALFASQTGGASISDIDDGYAASIGIARRFSDTFSGSVSFGYEPAGDVLVSPLTPTNGVKSISVGGQYTMDSMILSGGVRYSLLGDAQPETGTPDVGRAVFTDNDVVSIGLSVGYRF